MVEWDLFYKICGKDYGPCTIKEESEKIGDRSGLDPL